MPIPTPFPPQFDVTQVDIVEIISKNQDNVGFGIGLGLPIGIIFAYGAWKVLSPFLKMIESKTTTKTEQPQDSLLMRELKAKMNELELYLLYHEKLKKYDQIISADSTEILRRINTKALQDDEIIFQHLLPLSVDKASSHIDELDKILYDLSI